MVKKVKLLVVTVLLVVGVVAPAVAVRADGVTAEKTIGIPIRCGNNC